MATTTRPTTAAEIERILRSTTDTEADAHLLDHWYRADLTRYASRQGSPEPEAMANLALWEGLKAIERRAFPTEQAFRAYLYRTIRSRAIDEGRRRIPIPVDDQPDEALPDPTDHLIEIGWMREHLDVLTPLQRDVVIGRFYEDLPAEDIAARLGKSPNGIYQIQHRALARLRKALVAAAALGLLIIALVIVRQAATTTRTIDSGPIEAPTTTTPADATASTEADDGQVVGPDQRQAVQVGSIRTELTDDIVDDVAAPGPGTTSAGTGPALTTTRPILTPAPATAPPSTAGATTMTPATFVAAPTTTPTTTAVATTPRPQSTTTSTSTPPPTPAIPTDLTPNTCGRHDVPVRLAAMTIFDPAGDPDAADAFVGPTMVRFLAANGTSLARFALSEQTGNTIGASGWIDPGNGTGTHTTFAAAPSTAHWGFLYTPSRVVGWQSVEYFDGASWIALAACT